MRLQVPPGSPWWISAGAEAILVLHISGGTAGVLAGGVALLSEKGGKLHRAAGNVFFVSMLLMAGIGAGAAPFLPQRPSIVAGLLTFYLVATSWATVRRKEGMIGRFEFIALVFVGGIIALSAFVRWQAGDRLVIDHEPTASLYAFMSLSAVAAAGDLHVILRRGILGSARIARHLWRMCTAFLIAAASFFLGQPQIMPALLRGSPVLFLPEILILGSMVFWLIWIRIGRLSEKRTNAQVS